MKPIYSLPEEDLQRILSQTERFWSELRGKRVFLTGGTGFFGSWLLESFGYVNQALNLDSSLTVLTRSVEGLKRRLPHFFDLPGVQFVEGDIRTFSFPEGNFSHIIHAATSSGTESLTIHPLDNYTTMMGGTERIMKFAQTCGVKKFLYVSSGAVYGDQPGELSHLSEDYRGAPNQLSPKATYGECKRLAEHLTVLNGQKYGYEAKIARPFAFVGPYLPLDAGFAIGNFFKNVLQGEPIQIGGDGTPYRSYLYAGDLATWLWTILFQGKTNEAYNIGSEEAISIAELAKLISNGPWVKQKIEVRIAKQPVPGVLPARYVPSNRKARVELGLKQNYTLTEAIDRSLKWHRG